MRALLFLLALLVSVPSAAQNRIISVTRESSDLYRVMGQSAYVYTRYCYEYAYSEEVVLTGDQMIFTESGERCTVNRILAQSQINSGTYEVSVSHEDDELYSTLDGIFLKTSLCFEFVYYNDSVLRWNGFSGTLIFENGDSCRVEAVLSEVR